MKNYPEEIKWIFCQRVSGREWIVRGLTMMEKPRSIDDSDMLERTPIGEMRESEFAVFRNRPNWQDFKPHRYLDCRNRRDARIGSTVGGIINSLQADWF